MDVSPGLPDDAVAGGQSQTSALALVLSGEEGLEQVGHYPLVHANARVLDRKHDVLPRLESGGSGVGVGAESDFGDPDGQLASLGHGVPGVDGEVGQDLLYLTRVNLDHGRIQRGQGDQLDVLSNEAPEHPYDTKDILIQVNDSGLDHLPAGEGQELAGDGGRTLGGRLYLGEVAAYRVVRREFFLRYRGEAQDAREQVVEVVGDAARQPAHHFHLLGLE